MKFFTKLTLSACLDIFMCVNLCKYHGNQLRYYSQMEVSEVKTATDGCKN